MPFTDRDYTAMTEAYVDNELIPTEPEELKRYLAWKKSKAKKGARAKRRGGGRVKPPEFRPDLGKAIADVFLDENANPLLSLADATINMMEGEDDNWNRSMEILYGSSTD